MTVQEHPLLAPPLNGCRQDLAFHIAAFLDQLLGAHAVVDAGNALLGALALMIGSAVSTAVAKKGAANINESGDDAGISAVPGHKFIVLSWVAFGLMGATLLFWTLACWSARRAAGGRAFASDHHHHRTYVGEKPGRPSASSDRGLVGGFFRRNR